MIFHFLAWLPLAKNTKFSVSKFGFVAKEAKKNVLTLAFRCMVFSNLSINRGIVVAIESVILFCYESY